MHATTSRGEILKILSFYCFVFGILVRGISGFTLKMGKLFYFILFFPRI